MEVRCQRVGGIKCIFGGLHLAIELHLHTLLLHGGLDGANDFCSLRIGTAFLIFRAFGLRFCICSWRTVSAPREQRNLSVN